MRNLFLFILTLGLSGCVEYQWVKPGADKQQENIVETRCKAQALKDLPPDNMVRGKYTSKNKKDKTTDTSYSTSDANESQRDVLIKDCMYRKGWEQIEVNG
ncbi:hypothetical protein WD218_004808 [Klebsiella variicola]